MESRRHYKTAQAVILEEQVLYQVKRFAQVKVRLSVRFIFGKCISKLSFNSLVLLRAFVLVVGWVIHRKKNLENNGVWK